MRFPADATWHSSKNEIVFFSTKAGAQLYYDLKITVFVAFDEMPIIGGKPVCGFFDKVTRMVEIAITLIEAEARRLGFVN
jgi:hypothetical protein